MSNKYSERECKRLDALRAKATEGPWAIREHQSRTLVWHENETIKRGPPVAKCDLTHGMGQAAEDDRNNAAFIASIHSLADQLAAAREIIGKQREALEFYADPLTYFAIGFFPDRPCGDFMEDFEELDHEDLGETCKPGKRAREALRLTEESSDE